MVATADEMAEVFELEDESDSALDIVEMAWQTWRQAALRLVELEPKGWLDSRYAPALQRERAAYTELISLQAEARGRSLPVRCQARVR